MLVVEVVVLVHHQVLEVLVEQVVVDLEVDNGALAVGVSGTVQYRRWWRRWSCFRWI
jgi:hypothetical protein